MFVFLSLDVLAEALDQRFFLVRKQDAVLRKALCVFLNKRRAHTGLGHKEVHLVLVAALKNIDILCRAVRISLVGVEGQILPVSFRSYAHIAESLQCRK